MFNRKRIKELEKRIEELELTNWNKDYPNGKVELTEYAYRGFDTYTLWISFRYLIDETKVFKLNNIHSSKLSLHQDMVAEKVKSNDSDGMYLISSKDKSVNYLVDIYQYNVVTIDKNGKVIIENTNLTNQSIHGDKDMKVVL
jgi:hypothetical protein